MKALAKSRPVAFLVPDLRGGGAERVCVSLANAFSRQGTPVEIVLMREEGELLELLDPEVKVVCLRAPRVRSVLWSLIKYLRTARPAAVVANMWPLTAIAVIAKRMSRVDAGVIVVEHSNWTCSIRGYRVLHQLLFKLSMRFIWRFADRHVGVSRGVAEDVASISGLSPDRIETIYNPVAGSRLRQSCHSLAKPPVEWLESAGKRVLAVGTLKEVKRFDRLIRAFAEIDDPESLLLILGEGEERDSLTRLAEELRISQRVMLPGFARDPVPYFKHADVFVLSSDHEGFGNVIVEALEQGIPVVSTDCPSGPREILDNGLFGTLVPVGDVGALSKSIRDALHSQHDVDALKRRAQDFSEEKAVQAYARLIAEVSR